MIVLDNGQAFERNVASFYSIANCQSRLYFSKNIFKKQENVYADQKLLVKKKVSFNKSSKNKTGGGPYEEKALSIADEQILEAAEIDVAVAGLKEVRIFGSQIQDLESSASSKISQSENTDDNISELMDAIDSKDKEEKQAKKSAITVQRRRVFVEAKKLLMLLINTT